MRMVATASRPRGLNRQLATWGLAYAFAVTMLGTTLPTPLYPLYEQRMGFSGLIVTVVFATYAVGVIVALLFLGQQSDRIGRRPVLLAGLALAASSSVVFLIAQALPALLVGRLLSGFSAGIFTGTATAGLIDLAPAEARGRATLIATIANIGGLGLGPLLAGALAQLAPDPLRLAYFAHLGLLIPAAIAVLVMPEPVDGAEGAGALQLRVQRLRVPREMRGTFARGAAASFAGFAVMGLFTAVAPAFLAQLLGLPSHVLAGVVVFVVFAASCGGQLALEAIPATGLPLGCVGMIAGAGLIAGSIAAGSLALLICGAGVGGFGIGLSFRAGLAAINREAPSDKRGEVASSFFVIAYLALAIPIIGVGAVSQAFSLRTAGLVFSGFVAALALAVLVSLTMRRDDSL
jgi:predicted MFS family arabinose efflux permease